MLLHALVAAALVSSSLPVLAQTPGQAGVPRLTTRAQAARALDRYFAAFRNRDFSRVPFTPGVVFQGSLHPEPIRGDSAVRAFLVGVAEGARGLRLAFRVIDGDRACAQFAYESTRGFDVPAVECFRFEGGRIAELRPYFDPRPFLDSAPPAGAPHGAS